MNLLFLQRYVFYDKRIEIGLIVTFSKTVVRLATTYGSECWAIARRTGDERSSDVDIKVDEYSDQRRQN